MSGVEAAFALSILCLIMSNINSFRGSRIGAFAWVLLSIAWAVTAIFRVFA